MLEFEYYGLAAIFILVGGLTLLINIWPKSVHATFSQHAASSKVSSIYYFALFVVVSVLLYPYFNNVFNGRDTLDTVASVTMTAALILQMACTLFPETKGRSAKIHQILAGLSAMALLLTQLAVVVFVHSIMFGVSFMIMAAIVYYVVCKRSTIRYALLVQLAFYVAFFMPFIGLNI